MGKILSLIFVYIFSSLVFAFINNPTYADRCAISFNPTADGNQEFEIQLMGQPNGFFTATITDPDNPTVILDSSGAQTDSIGNAIITLRAPSAAGTYTVSAKDVSVGSNNDCSGTDEITVSTNVGSCAGFLGCIGGISVKNLKFTNYATFIEELISSILPIILGVIGFITVIIIIISGIQFITSSGNPEAAAAARSRLTLAIVGFVIVVLAFAITQIIDKIFLGGSGVF